jgi:hypothetical protein
MYLKLIFAALLFTYCINQSLLLGQNKVRNLSFEQKKTNKPDSLQKQVKNTFHFKVYYNFYFGSDKNIIESKYYNYTVKYEATTANIGRISASFAIENPKSIHEIELSRISINKVDNGTFIFHGIYDTAQVTSGQKTTIFNLNIKYEYNRRILKIKDRFEFLLGASAEPYIESIISKPIISTSFKSKGLYVGSKLYLTPRAIYNLDNRFYLDLNFPVEIYDFYFLHVRIFNPTLPEDLKKSNEFHSDFFNKIFQFKLGFGIRI